jgi:hypothetical protein
VNFPCVRCASVVRDVRLGTPLRRDAAVLRRRSPELAGPDASWPSRAEARLAGGMKSARPAAGVLLVGEGAASVGSRSRRGASDYLLSVCILLHRLYGFTYLRPRASGRSFVHIAYSSIVLVTPI